MVAGDPRPVGTGINPVTGAITWEAGVTGDDGADDFSTPQATYMAATYATLASPTFTGVPAAPTAAADTDTTQVATTAFVLGQASDVVAVVDGVAAAGTSEKYSRTDHVHPTNTVLATLASPTFTGVPAAPTAAADTDTTQVATTAFVLGQASDTVAVVDGVAVAGTSEKYSRTDHVHPTNTALATLASPTFTGVPAAPTAAADTDTTQVATTAFVLGQASDVVAVANGPAAAGASEKYSRYDHVHPTDTTMALKSSVHTFLVAHTGTDWTKPAGAIRVHVRAVSAGSGGGSGRKSAAGGVRCGGGGAGGGAVSEAWFLASDLTATVPVTVGAGGAGGAAQTTNDTDGNVGVAGGLSAFGGYLLTTASTAGGAGLNNAGAAGTGGGGRLSGGAGAAAGTDGTAGSAAAAIAAGGGGGGAGGGIAVGNAAANGSAGGLAVGFAATAPVGGIVDTTVPAAGATLSVLVAGSGGGGGGASGTTNAQTGGAGGYPGGGGGGGGAGLNDVGNSGAGGLGGDGVVVVTTYF